MNIGEDIMNVLIKHAHENHDYINPDFLQTIDDAVTAYFHIENKDVDKWISNMWSR